MRIVQLKNNSHHLSVFSDFRGPMETGDCLVSEMNQSYIVWEVPTRIPLGCTGCLNVSLKLSKRRKQRLSVHCVPSMWKKKKSWIKKRLQTDRKSRFFPSCHTDALYEMTDERHAFFSPLYPLACFTCAQFGDVKPPKAKPHHIMSEFHIHPIFCTLFFK